MDREGVGLLRGHVKTKLGLCKPAIVAEVCTKFGFERSLRYGRAAVAKSHQDTWMVWQDRTMMQTLQSA